MISLISLFTNFIHHQPYYKLRSKYAYYNRYQKVSIMQKEKPGSRQLKERVPTGLSKKQRSPYTLQYLQFQKRLGSKRACRLPSIPCRNRNADISGKISDQEYLALAKHLKANKEQIIFYEDKENTYVEEDEISQQLIEMKGIIDKMKHHYGPREEPGKRKLSELQYSQQMTNIRKLQTQQSVNHRSRALSSAVSNALNPLKEIDQNAKINFLNYKKGKREFPTFLDKL